MIARIWRGSVRRGDADAYVEYLRETGIAEYAATPGNRGVWMLRRDQAERTEFLLLTLWGSVDDVKAFAGEDYERAVFYPEDERFLLERDFRASHFEVAASAGGPWTATAGERSRVIEFFDAYRAAFQALDAEAIADLFAYPCQVTGVAGQVSVMSSPSREAWLPQLEQLVVAYRALEVRAAHILELDTVELAPTLSQATVRWELRGEGDAPIYAFDASYTLVDRGDGLRIAAIAHNETRHLLARRAKG